MTNPNPSPFAALAAAASRTQRQPAPSAPAAAQEPVEPQTAAPAENAAVQHGTAADFERFAPTEPAPQRTLQVLTSTGNGQFDAILAGCVGSLDASGAFQPDADYAQLSYLFTLASGSSLPVVRPGQETEVVEDGEIVARLGERAIELTMPAAAAQALKINCVANAARGWEEMYDVVARMAPAGAMGAAMIQTERANVARAVANYVGQAGLQAWRVPVIYQATVFLEDPAHRANTESGLLEQAEAMSVTFAPDVTRTPEPADATNAAPAANQVPENWASHNGPLQLTVEGSIKVLAASAEDAAQVGSALIMVARNSPRFGALMKPEGEAIQAARLLPPSTSEDDSYDRMRG